MFCVEYANRILDWMENLPDDEMPPAWMWTVDHELEKWFERVKEKRDEKYGRGDDDRNDTVVPMTSNELAEGRR